jgi:hypothetical protein
MVTPDNASAMQGGFGRETPVTLPLRASHGGSKCSLQASGRMGILTSLRALAIRNRLSLYVDDLVIFIVPTVQDLCCIRAVLDTFSRAMLQYLQESVHTDQMHPRAHRSGAAPTTVAHFPFMYLGAP